MARGLVWGAARVTALYGRVKQTTPYTGDVRFTHTGRLGTALKAEKDRVAT